MKYRINRDYTDGSFDVIVEDGGVASVYHNGNNFVTTYYAVRLGDCDRSNYIWDELSTGKAQHKDWGEREPMEVEMIKDALEYLVFPPPQDGWQEDNTIWEDAFKPVNMKTAVIKTMSNLHWFSYEDEDKETITDSLEATIENLEALYDSGNILNPDHSDALHDAIQIIKSIKNNI
jgi:hypothetical protein